MALEQANNQWKKFWLFVLFFSLFFLLGLWQTLLIPFFQGPDEQVHYATVQYWAEPTEKTWPLRQNHEPAANNDIRTWNFSKEVRETAHRLEFDQIKWQTENTLSFVSNSPFGAEEATVLQNNWLRVIDAYPINASGTWSFYYFFTGKIESWLAEYSIFDRLFAARMFSLCIGALAVLLTYFTARKLGWGIVSALAFSSLIAFQPMFLATSTIINIDIFLIFAFTLFFFGSVYWIIDGPSCYRGLLLVTATLVGIFAKGPGIVLLGLLGMLFGTSLYQRYGAFCREKFIRCLLGLFVIITLFFIFTPPAILANFLHLGSTSAFSSFTESIAGYLEKTISWNAFSFTSLSYWGNFGWLDTNISTPLLHTILAIEIIALFGLLWLFFDRNLPSFLPHKKILFFALLSILALQLAIRFFDWRIFDTTGKILIGTPGRYFLPNILPHMLLVVSGLGYWLGTKERFQFLLRLLSAGMLLLIFYCSWFIILPRYYL